MGHQPGRLTHDLRSLVDNISRLSLVTPSVQDTSNNSCSRSTADSQVLSELEITIDHRINALKDKISQICTNVDKHGNNTARVKEALNQIDIQLEQHKLSFHNIDNRLQTLNARTSILETQLATM